MRYPTLKHWLVALDTTVLEVLATRPDLAETQEVYFPRVERCPQHGGHCVVIVYGAFCQHVVWSQTEPGPLAESLLATMMPQPEPEVLSARADSAHEPPLFAPHVGPAVIELRPVVEEVCAVRPAVG
jgi:hypothetical protein